MTTTSPESFAAGITTPAEVLETAARPERAANPDFDGFVRNTAVQVCTELFDVYLPNGTASAGFVDELVNGTGALLRPFINPNDFKDMPSGADIGALLVELISQSGGRTGDIGRLPAQFRAHARDAARHITRFARGTIWEQTTYRERFINICESIRRERQVLIPLQRHRRGRR